MNRNFSIVKLEDLSGEHASFYTIKFEDDDNTLFENFLSENQHNFEEEVIEILDDISIMADKTGCDDGFFKLKEGNISDGVCALYDRDESNLRLYCIKYGRIIVVLGGGGEKPKGMHALQESEKLTEENELVRKISGAITQALIDGVIEWCEEGMNLLCDDSPIVLEF